MNTPIKNSLLLPALITFLGLLLAERTTAQTFTTLHSFMPGTNSDGAGPSGSLVLLDNNLYGTTEEGGISGMGAVFKININGSGYTNLCGFSTMAYNGRGVYTNSDGATPSANLILAGNTFYGTARNGGVNGDGTVFSIRPDGTGFTNLHSFSAAATNELGRYTNSDGAAPLCGLAISGSTLYGTASGGGLFGDGSIFRVNTDGTGFTNLHSFTAYSSVYFYGTNSDGYAPQAGVVVSGNALYGTAEYGGVFGKGTVFKVNTNGIGFTNLYSFTGGNDGDYPIAGLILSGNILYGTANAGGYFINWGTVFAINTDGLDFTNLHSFSYGDGSTPQGALILSGHTLYGTTTAGGSAGTGALFAGNTDGTGFMNLYSFTAGNYDSATGNYTNSDGYQPSAALILSGNTLYGTAFIGGVSDDGTVFSFSLSGAPQLTITPAGADVIVAWPANASGYTLEFATNLVPPVLWNTNLPAPVIVSGQNTVTNAISGKQQFYRLSQ